MYMYAVLLVMCRFLGHISDLIQYGATSLNGRSQTSHTLGVLDHENTKPVFCFGACQVPYAKLSSLTP